MHTSPLAWLALRAIALYQRYLSPRKGYRCALHVLGGGRSCSAYGYRAIARGGLFNGLVLLRRRVEHCARANVRRATPPRLPGLAKQQGFCAPLDCGDCGVPHESACHFVDACSEINPGCGGDWPWRRQKPVRPDRNLDDYMNNEKALRERIRVAQLRRRDGPEVKQDSDER